MQTTRTSSAEVLSRKRDLIARLFRNAPPEHAEIAAAILAGERLSPTQGLELFQHFPLTLLGLLATYDRIRKNGLRAYFNRNAHIEPTNVCEFRCAFCSYRRARGENGAWELSLEQIEEQARSAHQRGVTELHLTGGALPGWRLSDLIEILRAVRRGAPGVHVKAFSAVELVAVFQREVLEYKTGLATLRTEGLDSIPGGGAEIFTPEVRQQICPTKANAAQWLSLHREAHRLGISSNATMLYGHVETQSQRISHLESLRQLQDETGGFNCFIPLKFRAQCNELSHLGEIHLPEVLRTYAVSRLYLDNIPHLKAYWPMLGKENIPVSLAFGADDLDGTIGDSTRIYSMAGSEEQRPDATVEELEHIIRTAGYEPVERDSLYHPIC